MATSAISPRPSACCKAMRDHFDARTFYLQTANRCSKKSLDLRLQTANCHIEFELVAKYYKHQFSTANCLGHLAHWGEVFADEGQHWAGGRHPWGSIGLGLGLGSQGGT